MIQKLLRMAFLLAALWVFSACEDYLNVNLYDQATLDETFRQTNTAHQYLRHIYSYIPEDESISNREGWVVARSDEAQFSWTQWVYYLAYRTDNYSPATGDFHYWSKFYTAINQCTIFINNIDKDKNEKDPRVVVQMKAEARFLRAYYYYCLFRQYGPVFLWWDPESGEAINADDKIEAASVDRHTVDQNIRFIVSELDKAIADLPVRVDDYGEQANSWQGRATKGAAMAVKSRVTLMAASPLYNGCDLYKGQMQNIRGEFLFPQSEDPAKWETAAAAAKELIDLADSGVYSLVKGTNPGASVAQQGASDYEAVFQQAWNSETIWGWWKRCSSEFDYLYGNGQTLACTLPPPRQEGARKLHWYGFSGITPSLKLVDAFPMMESGRYPVTGYDRVGGQLDYSRPTVDPRSGYQAEGWTDNYKVPVNADWAPAFKAHNSTVGRDPRYYASLVPNGFPWPNKNKRLFLGLHNDKSLTSYWEPTGDANRVGYVWRKWYPTDTNLDDNDSYKLQVVYPSIRLAEIYLNYAEACNEKPSRNEAEALKYINLVRERVGLNKVEEAYPEVLGNQQLLRWIIRMERMCEFNGEALRHYDACRWMIAKDEYNTKNWTLKLSSETYEGSYERVSDDYTGGDPSFVDRDYLMPIYTGQLSEMTNLTQNYGF